MMLISVWPFGRSAACTQELAWSRGMLHHIIKIAISVDLDTHAHSAALLTLTIADMSFFTHSARVYCHGPDHFTPEGKTLITHRSLIDTPHQ